MIDATVPTPFELMTRSLPLPALCGTLSELGFDLVQPLQVGWYNAVVEPHLRLDDFGAGTNLALVIGNTRHLWSKLLARLRSDSELARAEHPVEAYTEDSILRALRMLAVATSVRWSHERGAASVAFQRLAHVAGLAYLSPTHLSVHSVYGSWIALRAVVSLPVSASELEKPELQHPCGDCTERCLPAFERAVAAHRGPLDQAAIRAHFPLWVAFRDACPTGRAERYTDAQIRYHYLADREQLLAASPVDSLALDSNEPRQ